MALYGLAYKTATAGLTSKGDNPSDLNFGTSVDESTSHLRHLLFVHVHSNCTPRSVETYPPDLFTLEQKQHGAIIIHIAVAVWLFAALAVICNDYFLASMEVLC
uniref:Transmembrane protein 107 n=1 Tax=Macrostomum lignano TaxID=282301 RepID=A0A1I8I270_9PLAT